MAIPLPIQEGVRDFLTDLLGKGAAVSKSQSWPITAESEGLVAVYVDDDGEAQALCITDLEAAASLGAALAMVPATALDEVQRDRALPDNILENYKEVANILASILNSPTTPHVSLEDVYTLPGAVPEEVWEAIEYPSKRRDYDVTIVGYSSGKMTLIVV